MTPDYLPVTIYQQHTEHTCGPAALLTALSYFQQIPAELTEQALAHRMATNRHDGTEEAAMIETASQLGYTVASGDGGTAALLHERFKNQQPCVVSWNTDDDYHFCVVIGVDDHKVALADPWYRGVKMIDRDAFERAWVNSQGVRGWWMALRAPFRKTVNARYLVAYIRQNSRSG